MTQKPKKMYGVDPYFMGVFPGGPSLPPQGVADALHKDPEKFGRSLADYYKKHAKPFPEEPTTTSREDVETILTEEQEMKNNTEGRGI